MNELYDLVFAHPFLPIQRKLNRNVATSEALGVQYDEETVSGYKSDRDEGKSIDRMRPSQYEVITTGWVKGGYAERQIKAEFNIQRAKKIQLISWTDNYIPPEEWDPNQEIEGDELI